MRIWLGLCAVALLLYGCSSGGHAPHVPPKLTLVPTDYHHIYGWDDDNHSEPLAAFLQSCTEFAVHADNDAIGRGMFLGPEMVWKGVCRRAQLLPTNDDMLAKQFFETNFIPFTATNNGETGGLFTGYYEPLLMGSRTQSRPFLYPVYGAPVLGTPSYTRSQIDLGMLKGHAPIIAYVDDPVQLFFLHIQGSGRILLDNHQTIQLGYAGTNGQSYVSIGRVLIGKNILTKEQVTMPALKQWLYDHPSDMWQVMWENPSYVFFREMTGPAIGSEKVPLTPRRSLAVDVNFIPLGMPVFIDTVLPETAAAPVTIHRKLYIAQDTGGAIKGPVRGDIFFGFGPEAEELAGRMKSGGTATFLVPRQLALALAKPVP